MQGAPWGGSEELWSQTATELKGQGHSVWASVEAWPQLSNKVTALAQQGIKIETRFSFQIGRGKRIWSKVSLRRKRIYGRLRRFNPDLVVISQGQNCEGFEWSKVCREAGIPYVIILHCNNEFAWFEDSAVGEAAASYAGAHRVFYISRNNLDLLCLQLGTPLLNVELVRNPYNVSPEGTPPWPDESEGWRLACVARTDLAAKGQHSLLQILARPEWRKRPIELSYFGVGPHSQTLRRIADMLKVKVHFPGHVADIRAIWERNHLLLLPSRYEGLPLALVEAMWCARPAVVTDVGSNAELCADGETGFVAPSANVSSFSHALERAWERRMEWQQLGQMARARVENQIPRDPVLLFGERLKACVEEVRFSPRGPVRSSVQSE